MASLAYPFQSASSASCLPLQSRPFFCSHTLLSEDLLHLSLNMNSDFEFSSEDLPVLKPQEVGGHSIQAQEHWLSML